MHSPSSSNPATTRYHLVVADSAEELATRTAQAIGTALDLVLAMRERAQIALAGGETPKAAYRLLGQQHLPWDRVDVLLGDERWVQFENGLYLPEKQAGFTILFEEK